MDSPIEKVFFQDKNVTVTQSRLVVDGTIYAMRNISSVSTIIVENNSLTVPLIIIVAGIILMMVGSGVFGSILFAGAGAYIYFKKNEYAVRITSNSGLTNAFISKDKQYIQKIVDAVSEAMIYRG